MQGTETIGTASDTSGAQGTVSVPVPNPAPGSPTRLAPLRVASQNSPYASPARRNLAAQASEQSAGSSEASGAAASRRGAKPVARRTLAELETDTKSTGMQIPSDLPADFPHGPWLVDDEAQDPDKGNGWSAQEKKWLKDMQVYCSSTTTPAGASHLDWRMGSFCLAGVTRVPPSVKSVYGTSKVAACTGKGRTLVPGTSGARVPSESSYGDSESHKGKGSRCDFEIKCEFVSEANGKSGEEAMSGWVTKVVKGGMHTLRGDKEGHMHELELNQDVVMMDGNLRKGAAHLMSEPYASLGTIMKKAGMGAASIYATLKQKATDEGVEAPFNRDDVRRAFSITHKEELLDFEALLHVLEKDNLYHQVCVYLTIHILARAHASAGTRTVSNSLVHRWGFQTVASWIRCFTRHRLLCRVFSNLKVLATWCCYTTQLSALTCDFLSSSPPPPAGMH